MRISNVFAATVLAGGVLVTGATAASANQNEPGTPGDKNCVGQTNAFLAQLGKNVGADDPRIRGYGGLAKAVGLSTSEVQEIVRTYCSGTL